MFELDRLFNRDTCHILYQFLSVKEQYNSVLASGIGYVCCPYDITLNQYLLLDPLKRPYIKTLRCIMDKEDDEYGLTNILENLPPSLTHLMFEMKNEVWGEDGESWNGDRIAGHLKHRLILKDVPSSLTELTFNSINPFMLPEWVCLPLGEEYYYPEGITKITFIAMYHDMYNDDDGEEYSNGCFYAPLPPLLKHLVIEQSDIGIKHYPDTLEIIESGFGLVYTSTDDLTHLTNLKELIYWGEGCIRTLLPFTSLVKLRIDCMVYLPNGLGFIPGTLEWLNCSKCKLTSLCDLPLGLKVLNCSDNSIKKLPKLPPGLEQLNCSGTMLRYIPKLPPSLKVLKMREMSSLVSMPKLPLGIERVILKKEERTNVSQEEYTWIGI